MRLSKRREIIFFPSNWNFIDLFRAVRDSTEGRDQSIPRLERRIKKIYGATAVRATDFGRTALSEGIERLGIGRNKSILLPTIICPTVIRAIIKTGRKPVLADVESDFHLSPATVEHSLTKHVEAVVVPHLYGASAPIGELREYCRKRGLLLIDDAAQVFGVRKNGRLLGTYGDIGILSFGPFKSIGISRGGAWIRHRPFNIPADSSPIIYENEPVLDVLKRISSCIVKHRFRSNYLAATGFWEKKSTWNKKEPETPKRQENSENRFPEQRSFNLSAVESNLIYHVLSRYEQILSERSEMTERIAQLLRNVDEFAIAGPENAPYSKIPIRIQTPKLDAKTAIRKLASLFVEAQTIYQPLHLFPGYKPFASSEFPTSVICWEKIFLIPNPIEDKGSSLTLLENAFQQLATSM